MQLNDETWHRIKAELEKKLALERGRLEDPKADHNATQISRGRISMLKELLALPQQLEALARNVDPA